MRYVQPQREYWQEEIRARAASIWSSPYSGYTTGTDLVG